MIQLLCCLHFFQLTALVVRCPSELHPVFTVFLDGVAIDHEKVNGAVAWAQDFVSHPLFTQRNFFSVTGTSMLNTAIAAANTVRHSSEFDPWGAIQVETGQVIAVTLSCVRRKSCSEGRLSKIHWSAGLVQKLLHHHCW